MIIQILLPSPQDLQKIICLPNALFLLYQVLTGEKVVGDKTIKAIKNIWWGGRHKATFSVPTDEGIKRIESEYEIHATFVVRTYWFGRQYGLIDEKW